ncbi:MAG: hypothetical protein N4A39_05955 [Roseicyclus sp.]|jgi:hypothetical protein|nr:hypothetical protein [Roseicyclus sp.]
MLELIRNFAATEDGIVTVDWVWMTAACVALGLSATLVLSGGMNDLSGELQGSLLASNPDTEGFATFVGRTPDTPDTPETPAAPETPETPEG